MADQFGGFYARISGARAAARQLNPMREALLASQPGAGYVGPMASPDAMDAQTARTPQQQMVMAAAQNPLAFARTANYTPEGALALGAAVQGAPRTREVVVHGGDELNQKLGLGLANAESAVVQLQYDPTTDRQMPGFTVKSYKTAADNTETNRQSYGQSSALAEVMALEERRKAAGQPAFTPQEFESELNRRRFTSGSQQDYLRARDDHIANGGSPQTFPPFEQWSPEFQSQLAGAKAGIEASVKNLTSLREAGTEALKKTQTLATSFQLLDRGVMTGAASQPRTALARTLDTLLGHETNEEAVSANTDAYLANAGRLVGQNITLFGAGTGLSDADREFAKLISGADVSMTEPALRMILELNMRGSLGEMKQYNDELAFLAQTNPLLAQQFRPLAIPDYTQLPTALVQAPKGMSPQEKIEFYLAQRPSYGQRTAPQGQPAAPTVAPQGRLPPNATPEQIMNFYRGQTGGNAR